MVFIDRSGNITVFLFKLVNFFKFDLAVLDIHLLQCYQNVRKSIIRTFAVVPHILFRTMKAPVLPIPVVLWELSLSFSGELNKKKSCYLFAFQWNRWTSDDTELIRGRPSRAPSTD